MLINNIRHDSKLFSRFFFFFLLFCKRSNTSTDKYNSFARPYSRLVSHKTLSPVLSNRETYVHFFNRHRQIIKKKKNLDFSGQPFENYTFIHPYVNPPLKKTIIVRSKVIRLCVYVIIIILSCNK